MKKTIKQINDYLKQSNQALLFLDETEYPYPNIPDDDGNFISDYNDDAASFDRYFVKEYGNRVVEYDATTDLEFIQNWKADLFATTLVYLDAWAKLYFALNVNYNPVYNVEEHTTTTYGQHVTDNEIGARQHTQGQQQNTKGQEIDSSTTSNVAIDSALEKESGKQEDTFGQRIDTQGQRVDSDLAAKDTVTSKQHVDTVDREGNIGVKSATELLNEELRQKKRLSFFANVFLVFVEEVGAYYELDFLQ